MANSLSRGLDENAWTAVNSIQLVKVIVSIILHRLVWPLTFRQGQPLHSIAAGRDKEQV